MTQTYIRHIYYCYCYGYIFVWQPAACFTAVADGGAAAAAVLTIKATTTTQNLVYKEKSRKKCKF